MTDKEIYINYTINWQQDYLNWGEFVDTITECVLQSNDFKEALEVISKIKSTL